EGSLLNPEIEVLLDKLDITHKEAKQQLEEAREAMIEAEIKFMRSTVGKGRDHGGLARDLFTGDVISTYPPVSRNPRWYREFLSENNNRRPNKKEYREIAIDHLRNGFEDDIGFIPPNETFLRLEELINELTGASQEVVSE